MIGKFLRRNLQCRFGTHWKVSHENGDIAAAGVCADCGKEFPALKWTRCPPRKQPKQPGEPRMKNYLVPKSPEFNALWDAITAVLEVPAGVKSLTLYLSHQDIVTMDITYYPKFIGELPEPSPESSPKPEGPDNIGDII